MNVVMLTWEYFPYYVGGLGIACQHLFPALITRGALLQVVLPYRYQGHEMPGRMVHSTDSVLFDDDVLKSMSNPCQGKKSIPLYADNVFEQVHHYAQRIGGVLRNQPCDIIHAHDWMGFQAGIQAKQLLGKPLIVHVHATVFNTNGGNDIDKDIYAIELAGMQAADKIITVSELMKSLIVREYPIAPEKIVVIHNGMAPLPAFNGLKTKVNDVPIVLFLGRLTGQKGPDYFLKMVQKIKQYRSNIRFVMAGTGVMERELHKQARKLGIADDVLFTGFLDQQEALQMFRSADVYIMPSTSEPFGLTSLEALSCGTPVIISKQSGVAEVLSHCIKVDYWNIDAMVDAVFALLDHAQLRQELVANGMQHIKTLTWDKVAEHCFELYKQVSEY